MTTKKQTATAQAATQTTKTAQPNANPANNAAPAQLATPAAVTGIQFAKPKAERQKSDRAFCDHVDSKGKRCSLRVMSGEGRTKCVNHVPAEEKLTEDEAAGLMTIFGNLETNEQIKWLARSIGWWKVKQLVGGKPEGDVVLNELVG